MTEDRGGLGREEEEEKGRNCAAGDEQRKGGGIGARVLGPK